MAESSGEEEVDLIEEDKVLIMERVARLRFGDVHHKESNEKESPEKADIKYFFKTGELSKQDRIRAIDSALEEFVKYGAKDKINNDRQEVSNEDRMMFIDIIEKIKSQNMKDDKEINQRRYISKKDEDTIKKILKTNTEIDYDSIHSMPTRPNSRCNSREKDRETRDEDNCQSTVVLYEKKIIANQISEEVEVIDIADGHDHCGERFLAQTFIRNKKPSNLNKCIIEEKSFNFSMYITPMNDAKSPFFIDKKEVSVKIYQDGLNDGWNPTQVVYEICSQLQWSCPEFKQHDYSMSRGFHFGVSVQEYHFIPKARGKTKKLAKHCASTFFLHFLGFQFSYEQSSELSTNDNYSQDYHQATAIKYKDTLNCNSYYNLPEDKNKRYHSYTRQHYRSNTEHTSNVTRQLRLGRPQNNDVFGAGANVFAQVMNSYGFLDKSVRGQKRSRSRCS